MKLCPNHISEVTASLRDKGLGKFIIDDSGEALTRARLWLEGGHPLQQCFEARMVAALEINRAAVKHNVDVGPGKCPLCALPFIAAFKRAPEIWIDNATDSLKLFAMENGLV